jgi:hypothetical protein
VAATAAPWRVVSPVVVSLPAQLRDEVGEVREQLFDSVNFTSRITTSPCSLHLPEASRWKQASREWEY